MWGGRQGHHKWLKGSFFEGNSKARPKKQGCIIGVPLSTPRWLWLHEASRIEVPMLKATVSGSFHRHMGAITEAVHELAARSVRVLSPADPRVVAQQGEFLFVASDPVRSVRLVQDRHLECIRAAGFLWLVCPDGYVGQSASMEIGYAAAVGVPIFATHAPSDLTLRQYVRIVPALATAIEIATSRPSRGRTEGILVDPHASIQEAHQILERIERELTLAHSDAEPTRHINDRVMDLHRKLDLPTLTH
jgi:hypothetical protein